MSLSRLFLTLEHGDPRSWRLELKKSEKRRKVSSARVSTREMSKRVKSPRGHVPETVRKRFWENALFGLSLFSGFLF